MSHGDLFVVLGQFDSPCLFERLGILECRQKRVFPEAGLPVDCHLIVEFGKELGKAVCDLVDGILALSLCEIEHH
jgi:hypothetical protein